MDNGEYNNLTEAEEHVIINKGTEPPFSGRYNKFYEGGVYHCKRCDKPLYDSKSKFKSGCGWPSFDDEIKDAVVRKPDADGSRVEILCANCDAHLGHVFTGEGFTDKNTRHCVNSISMSFVPADKKTDPAKAYFAGGCFWGVESLFEQKRGVLLATSGYMGGKTKDPEYNDVVRGDTGHVEAVEITYDPAVVDYEVLARYFFEIHDPTQANGQGPDIGQQYLSAVFVNDDNEEKIITKLIGLLKQKGHEIVTEIKPMSTFYPAEEYHQNYYSKTGKVPYCHRYKKRF